MVLEHGGRRTLPGAAAYWILAALFLMLFFASAAASPLYPVYQVKFGFSAATLTAIFAVYVLVLLITLLFFGSVSDYLGRLPMIITALVFSVAGCVVFLAAHGTGELGLAVGALVTSPGALASLRPRIAVPRQARATFAGAVPCLVATWALSGLYLSLGPSLAAEATGSRNLVWGGLVIFLLCGTGVAAALVFRGINPQTAVTGAGFGLGFQGAFRMITALATAGQRAGLVTAIFAVGYLAFSVPALIAGVSATKFGLHATALVYSASVAVLVVAATGVLLVRRSAVGRS
jgi:hypothetical protein